MSGDGHGRLERGAVHTLRRVILLILLSVLVTITAIGVAGLLSLMLDRDQTIGFGSSGLAQSLSFTLIAAPFGGLVYWLVRRSLTSFGDRHSVLWPVYLAVLTTIALTTGAIATLGMFAELVRGEWDTNAFATGVVWLAVWAWHRWMWTSPSHHPTRLRDVAPALSTVVGLAIGVSGAIATLAALVDAAVSEPLLRGSWWPVVLSSLIWVVGGAIIWWWHWVPGGIRDSNAGFARFVLVAVTGFASVALALGGAAMVLYVALVLAFQVPAADWVTDTVAQRLDQLADGVAMGLVGGALWAYHRRVVAGSSDVVRRSTRLVASGVALIMAASGFGVVVNALLATLATPIAETGARALLFGGISALLVGGVAWALLWRPLRETDAAWSTFGGRRVYLVLVFGVSALVALVTLLIVTFSVVESALGEGSRSLIETVRAPLGLLTATVLVAVYHFVVWRRDRPEAAPAAAAPRIGRVTLVAEGNSTPLADAVRAATGATVSVWVAEPGAEHEVEPGTELHVEPPSPDAAAVVDRLAEVSGAHLLVIVRGDAVDVIPLASGERHPG